MKALPHTPELLALAQKLIWFQPPEESLDHPIELMTYAMAYARSHEMKSLLEHVGTEGLAETIDARLPGVVDPRSWSYWNRKIGRTPPPLPKRLLPS